MIVCAVPVKDLVNAKQRLVPALEPTERRELARAMLSDVLAALRAARLDGVWVVTRDPEVVGLAAAFGAEPLASLGPVENSSHTSAVAFAQAEAARRGARVFLTVPGDVPCVTADEIRALAAAVADGAPAFAPSRSGFGTNGVALTPPDTMPLKFGEPSFQNHLAAARALGLEPRVTVLPGLALDVDAPEDVAALATAGGTTESARVVRARATRASWRSSCASRAASCAWTRASSSPRRTMAGSAPTPASTSPMWISIASRSSPRIRTAQRARCAIGSAPSPAPMSA